jgi:YidC/Oxa1 family membrane protein insertase
VAAIAVLTLLINLITLPLTLSQQRSARRMQELQPKLEELQKKHAKDKERLAQEQMKLYKEAGINPMGGCLPLLVQMPIWFGLIGAIRYCIPSTPLELFQFSNHIYKWLPGVIGLVPLRSTFLGMDLGAPPNPAQWWSYALPVLVFVTTWWQQKIMTPPAGAGTQSQASAMNQQMQIMMPLLFMFFTLSYATGLSVYFVLSSAIRVAQFYLMREGQHGQKAGSTERVRPKPSK